MSTNDEASYQSGARGGPAGIFWAWGGIIVGESGKIDLNGGDAPKQNWRGAGGGSGILGKLGMTFARWRTSFTFSFNYFEWEFECKRRNGWRLQRKNF